MGMTRPWAHRDELILGLHDPPLPLVNLPQCYLTSEQQRYHATIWGRTGSGKSKLLESIYLQALSKGQAVGFIDPHHDSALFLIKSLIAKGFFKQEGNFERLVYIDWANGAYVPFNVLCGASDAYSLAQNALS